MVIPPKTTETVSAPSQAKVLAAGATSSLLLFLRPEPVKPLRLVIKQPDPLVQQVAAIVGEWEVGDDLIEAKSGQALNR